MNPASRKYTPRRQRRANPGAFDEELLERQSRLLERRVALETGLADWQSGGRHRVAAAALEQPERFEFVKEQVSADCGAELVAAWLDSQASQVAAWPDRRMR